MSDPQIPNPAETAARLQAIIADRKALHAEEFRRLSSFQRAYAAVGMAVPLAKPRKKRAAAPAAPTPLLDGLASGEPTGMAVVGATGVPDPIPYPAPLLDAIDRPYGPAAAAARLIGEHDEDDFDGESDPLPASDTAAAPITAQPVAEREPAGGNTGRPKRQHPRGAISG
jgi:hypothetical protein